MDGSEHTLAFKSNQPIGLCDLFKQHTLRVCVDCIWEGKRHFNIFSGFMLEVGSLSLWVTAGHVIKKIREIQSLCDSETTNFGWADNSRTIDDARLPFFFDHKESFEYDANGIDFGCIIINETTRAHLDASEGNCFLSSPAWQRMDVNEAVSVFLVGFPSQLVTPAWTYDIYSPNIIESTVACIPLKLLERRIDCDPREFWSNPKAIYAELDESALTSKVTDITGMSGGPVIAIRKRKDGKLAYHVIGIQSSWLPESRIIRATDIWTLLEPIISIYKDVTDRSEVAAST